MIETRVRKQYDQLAAVYDLRWKSYIANTLSFLKTWADISPTDTVLDVACGTGEFERLLVAEYLSQQIVGVDISDKMLAIAQNKCSAYPQVSFKTASASTLPFDSDSFDVIVSANSFHYFDDPFAALKECYTENEFHRLLEDANFAVCRATRIRFGVVWGLMVATACLKT